MNAFVTGGSRGIGRAIVLKFIAEGYDCAFTYAARKDAADQTVELALKVRPDARIRAYELDLKNTATIEPVIEAAIADFENIHVLVNNAAIVRDNALALMSDEDWNEVIAANLTGPFHMIRGFIMHFISNRKGRIINISSLSAGGSSGQANYAASKAGLNALSNTVAREYARKGITCNVVTVGFVPTDMTDEHFATELEKIWMQYCPMRRPGTAEEIASMVYYLTTEDAGFVNGENISVSGGLGYVP